MKETKRVPVFLKHSVVHYNALTVNVSTAGSI